MAVTTSPRTRLTIQVKLKVTALPDCNAIPVALNHKGPTHEWLDPLRTSRVDLDAVAGPVESPASLDGALIAVSFGFGRPSPRSSAARPPPSLPTSPTMTPSIRCSSTP